MNIQQKRKLFEPYLGLGMVHVTGLPRLGLFSELQADESLVHAIEDSFGSYAIRDGSLIAVNDYGHVWFGFRRSFSIHEMRRLALAPRGHDLVPSVGLDCLKLEHIVEREENPFWDGDGRYTASAREARERVLRAMGAHRLR